MEEKKVKKRVPIRLNEESASKLEEMAERYGMTVNGLVSFIIGQWLDNNYDFKDYTRESMIPAMLNRLDPNMNEFLSNPVFVNMMRDLLMSQAQNDN